MVLYDKQGKVIAVYPPGSEEHWRFHRVLEILMDADSRYLEKLLNKKKEREEQVNLILDKPQFKSAFKVERIIKDLTRKQKEALVKGRRLDKVLEEVRSGCKRAGKTSTMFSPRSTDMTTKCPAIFIKTFG